MTNTNQQEQYLLKLKSTTMHIAKRLDPNTYTLHIHPINIFRNLELKQRAEIDKGRFQLTLDNAMSFFCCIILLLLTSSSTITSLTAQISTNTWLGTTDGDWMDSSNWSLTLIPQATHIVVIPADLNTYPFLDDHADTYQVIIEGDGRLDIRSTGKLYIRGADYGLNINNAGPGGTLMVDYGGLLSVHDMSLEGIRVEGGRLINNGTIVVDSCGDLGINLQSHNYNGDSQFPDFKNSGVISITNVGLTNTTPFPSLAIRSTASGALNDTCGFIYTDHQFSIGDNYGTLMIDDDTGSIIIYEDNHYTGIIHKSTNNSVIYSFGSSNKGIINNINSSSKRIWDGCGQNSNWSDSSNWSRNSIPNASEGILITHRVYEPIVDSSLDPFYSVITIDSAASLTIDTGGKIITNYPMSTQGTLTIHPDGELETIIDPLTVESTGVFVNKGSAKLNSLKNFGIVSNSGQVLVETLDNNGKYDNLSCAITEISNILMLVQDTLSNFGLLQQLGSVGINGNGVYIENGYQVDTSDLIPNFPGLLYSFEQSIDADFFHSDPNNNGSSICSGDTSDLSNRFCDYAFPLRCNYSYTGTNLWQGTDTKVLKDCANNYYYDYSGRTWFKIIGTGDSTIINVNLTDGGGDSEIHLYKGDCNGLTCIDGGYSGTNPSTFEFRLLAEHGTDYYIVAADYGDVPNIQEYNITVACSCSDLPLVYQSPNDFYNGNDEVVVTDSTIIGANIIYEGSQIKYNGADGVLLNPVFQIEKGAIFEATTIGCP